MWLRRTPKGQQKESETQKISTDTSLQVTKASSIQENKLKGPTDDQE